MCDYQYIPNRECTCHEPVWYNPPRPRRTRGTVKDDWEFVKRAGYANHPSTWLVFCALFVAVLVILLVVI